MIFEAVRGCQGKKSQDDPSLLCVDWLKLLYDGRWCGQRSIVRMTLSIYPPAAATVCFNMNGGGVSLPLAHFPSNPPFL